MSNDGNVSHVPYDLVVAGSGGAAMSAAITARQAGKTVLLVDAPEARNGGTARAAIITCRPTIDHALIRELPCDFR
jgi:pyruvate/2-oxoglutarate dehydrogenase complex dihydrolipoamide dehydrogenase (E3) component